MDSFLIKAYDRYIIGGTEEEKLWLSTFASHIRKYILKENSHYNCEDLSLSVLECLSTLIRENIHVQDDVNEQDTTAWNKCHVVSLESLSKKKGICAGQLNGDDTLNLTDFVSGHQPLKPNVPSFLIGYLKSSPSASKTTPTCGTLFLEDNSSYLPIEISNADINWLNQLVLLPSWMYIPVPGSTSKRSENSCCQSLPSNGYIEASSKCVPVFKTYKDNLRVMPMSLSVSDYQRSERTNKKISLNLHGKVTAISPVHSMAKSKPFFFIQLTCPEGLISTSIVVQGSQFMHWVHFLHLEKEYVLTGICETTMNKGTKNERKILACTKSSYFLDYHPEYSSTAQRKRKQDHEQGKAENSSTKRFKIIGDKHEPKGSPTNQEDPSTSKPVKTDQPLTLSYKGVITKSFNLEFDIGTYELDNKVRLYTVHQPCPHYGRGLRVGAEIALYNVHLVKKAKDVLGLCCCTLSTIRVTRFSALTSEWKPSVFTASPVILHGQNLSLPDYTDMAQSCGKLIKMFSSLFRPSSLIGYSSSLQKNSSKSNLHEKESKGQSAIAILLNNARATACLSNKPRNIYEEFFDHPHTCSPTRLKSICLATVYTIMEVRAMVMKKSKSVPWQASNNDVCSESSEWLYQIIQSKEICTDLVVIGCVKSSTTTGNLKLYDQTGNILIIMTIPDSDSDPSSEYRSLLDIRDCIVKLHGFTAVIEQFRNSAFDSLPDSRKTRIYFQARVGDLEILVSKESRLTDNSCKLNKEKLDLSSIKGYTINEKTSRSTKGPLSSMEEIEQLKKTEVFMSKSDENPVEIIQNKATLNVLDTKTNGNQPMKDHTLTSHASSVTCETHDNPEVFTCKVLFLVRHRENLTLKKKRRIFYTCAVDIKVLAYSSCERVDQHNDDKEASLNDLSEFSVKTKSIALRLQHQHVTWHPFLCHGCFYILEEKCPSRSSSLITKAMNFTSKPLLDVTSCMNIRQVCQPNDHRNAETKDNRRVGDVVMAMEEARERFMGDVDDKIKTIQDVLTSNKSEFLDHEAKPRKEAGIEQVNFKGRILNRELRLSDTTGQLLRDNNVLVPRFGPLEESTVQQMELGFGYLGSKTLFLRMQDLKSPNTVDVYMDLSRSPYMDGLIPGAIISCRRFLCKLSRGGNMYCSFDACSSINIDEPATEYVSPSAHRVSGNSSRACSSECTTEHSRLSSVPRRLLVDFVNCESSGGRIHTISQVRCKVTAVQKVSMRWQCARCGHVIIKEECSQGCAGTEGFRFSTEARCLIEDGTAKATLNLSEDTLPFLLRLSHGDMSGLRDCALNVGELVYQRYSYGSDRKVDTWHLVSRHSEANRILAEHCCSPKVKRSINIYCKHARSTKHKPDMGQTTEEEQVENIQERIHCFQDRARTNEPQATLFKERLLNLRAVAMEDINYQAEIQRLLVAYASETSKS